MCTSNQTCNEDEQYLHLKGETEKNINCEKYSHLFKEKVYYISRKTSQTLTTGYRPDKNGRFKFCIRFDDYRYSDFLTLTLFQFVNLLKDLRRMLYNDEENKILDEVDGSMQFSFKDINVPKVIIQVDATYSVPNIFELSLIDVEKKEVDTIVLDRKTIKRVIDYEGNIINTIEVLEDRPTNYLYDAFISKCVEHLESEKIERNHKKIYNEIKSIYKTPFQSEAFLKFWSLIYKIIETRLNNSEAVVCPNKS